MTSFEEAAALTRLGEHRWSGELPADWGQGRTTFGGLQAALATTVAQEVAGADRPLRTLDVGFVAPVAPGPVELEAEVLGRGRSATQLQVSIRSGGTLACRVHAVAGSGRESAAVVPAQPSAAPSGDPADTGLEFAYVEGVLPVFTQHIEMRWCSPALPFSGAGAQGAAIDGWCRHRTPASGTEAVVALLDAWPPTVLPMASGPAPSSSVRWSAHLITPVAPGEEKGWFWYQARTVHSGGGYATSYARLYSAGGELVMWSEQLISIYDRRSAASSS